MREPRLIRSDEPMTIAQHMAAVAAKIAARPLRRLQVNGRKRAFLVHELLGSAEAES
jgi:hypothetical protein